MSDVKDNGAAFPFARAFTKTDDGAAFDMEERGLTIRDYFAAAALQGCLAYSHYNGESWGDYHNNGSNESLAGHCYRLADAMIASRSGEG